MEKIIFFGLVIPIFLFVLYLGGRAIMTGFSAKSSNKSDAEIETNENTDDISNKPENLTEELNKLNELLHKSDWEVSEERVLLGRSVWKKQNGYKLKSIETELLTNLVGNLQQQPELPSTIHIENNK